MAKDWTICRLQAATVAELRAFALDWQRQADHGRMLVPPTDCIPLDWIVQELIRRVRSHRTRAKQFKRGRVYTRDGVVA